MNFSKSFPWVTVLQELLQCESLPWGQFFRNCSNLCPFHGVSPLGREFSIVSPFPWGQSFRDCSMWVPSMSSVLQELLHCESLSKGSVLQELPLCGS